MNRWILPLVLLGASVLARSQVDTRDKLVFERQQNPTVLHVQSRVDLSAKLPSDIVLPVRCGGDGKVYSRFADTSGELRMAGIANDGKVTTFSIPVTSGIQTPSWMSSFQITQHAVLGHVKGREKLVWKTAVPSKGEQLTVPTGPLSDYLVRFGLSGNFEKATKVELPFEIEQIAWFESSNTLFVSGLSEKTRKPVVALTTDDGEILRILSLPGDVTVESFQHDPSNALSDESWSKLSNAVETSTLTADGDRILLVREEQQGTPVFSISSSGDVRKIMVEAPSGYKLFSLTPTEAGWIAQFVKEVGDHSVQSALYLVDRNTGKLLESFGVDAPVGLGFACKQGTDFLFLSIPETGMQLLTASAK